MASGLKVLVVGSGGREHALCWRIVASKLCRKLWCAPGNAGIADVAECVNIAADDIEGLVKFARDNDVDFVVVGPEQPLVLGLVDRLQAAGIRAFGPTAAAAALEGSKGFMKDVLARCGVPTAAYGRFTDPAAAKDFVRKTGAPIVVKADGLAAGKGVIICRTVAEAESAIDGMMVDKAFGAAGTEVVVEEFLDGEEASFFALCDGTRAVAIGGAQDHKRAYDGDTGPNTGGMGTYSPAPVLTPDLEALVMRTCIDPVVAGMAAQGRPFTGILFAGLMIVPGPDGEPVPKVLEFNVRFGDPECQVLMARLESDLLAALVAAADGRLDEVEITWSPDAALCVVMAAEGYPGTYRKGTEIKGLDRLRDLDGVTVFHAGTRSSPDGRLLATGGRVLGVTARARTIVDAQRQAYAAVDLIDWPEGFCRRDIGWRAVNRG